MLKPLHDNILFVFTDDSAGIVFRPKTKSGLFIAKPDLSYSQTSKWGKVLATGPDCKEVKIGDYILIESLQWTPGFTYDKVRIWKTLEEKVMAITDDVDQTFQM